MTIEDQIRDEKQYTILIEKLQKYRLYHQAKLISTNISRVNKYCHLINKKSLNKLSLLILLWKKLSKNKQKRLKTQEKNK